MPKTQCLFAEPNNSNLNFNFTERIKTHEKSILSLRETPELWSFVKAELFISKIDIDCT